MLALLFDAAATILSVGILQAFNWAVTGHFKSDKMPIGMRMIVAASAITALAFLALLWTAEQPAAAQAAGMAIELCALGLFVAALSTTKAYRFRMAFDDGAPDQLVMSGPYRYIRHPFYASYLIYWGAFALVTFSWLALPLLLLIAAIYFRAARGEDRILAHSKLADQYSRYRQNAGMFWPRLRRR